ncbi:MAG TPA: hypothetical protein V6C91_18275 [Coleofasciculaceae cyanobacterium]
MALSAFVRHLRLTSSNYKSFMDSSGPAANSSDPHPNRWAEFMGAVIALLTLTLPVFVIAQYSSSRVDILQQTNYSLPRADK